MNREEITQYGHLDSLNCLSRIKYFVAIESTVMEEQWIVNIYEKHSTTFAIFPEGNICVLHVQDQQPQCKPRAYNYAILAFTI